MRKFLLLLLLTATPLLADQPNFWQRVEWSTPDGVKLVGKYHGPKDAAQLTWVLLHGLGSVKEEWDDFGRQLTKRGEGVFIVDLRGHGESVHKTTGETIRYEDWRNDPAPWARMPDDLGSARELIVKKFELKMSRVAVGGASLGANVAMTYAGARSDVPAVMLLSPGLEYAGIQTANVFKAYAPHPVLLAASPGDTYAYASIQQLAGVRGDASVRLLQGPNAEHGVNMFKDAGFTKDVIDWAISVGSVHS